MKPAERLELLRDVAGTRVYDERREQSNKILEETKARKAQIDDVLGVLEGRLQELEGEKAELAEYQELDRTRRALEFTLFTKEMDDIDTQLSAIEGDHREDVRELNEHQQQLLAFGDDIKAREEKQRTNEVAMQKLEKERELLQGESDEELLARARLTAEESTLAGQQSEQTRRYKELSANLKAIEKETAKTKKAIAALEPKYLAAAQAESDLHSECAAFVNRFNGFIIRDSLGF